MAGVGPEGMLSDSEAIEAVARDALARQQHDSTEDAADPRRNVVLYECKSCQRTELDTGAGAVVLDGAAAAALGCSAKVRDLDTEGRIVKRGGEVPAAVKRAGRLRDRNRCRNHACGRRRYVDVHHIEHREVGGSHSRANCVCLCTTCHEKLHARELFVEGDADGELFFYDARRELITATTGGDPIGSPLDDMTPAEACLLQVMGNRGNWHHDGLVAATGLGIVEVTRALVVLQLAGHIRDNGCGMFCAAQGPAERSRSFT
jgi:hypothetical protein